jgi:hypothetical protein
MPLGFAKDILAKGAAGGAAVPTSYFKASGTTSQGANGSALVLDRGSGNTWSSTAKKLTASFWFKGTTSDLPVFNDNAVGTLMRLYTANDEGYAINLVSAGIDVVIQESSYGNAYFGARPAGFATTYLDNNWHHCVVEYGAVTGSQNGRCFIDGVDRETTDGTDNITQTISNNRYMYINSDIGVVPTSAVYRDTQASTIAWSQVWIDFSKDYNIASNLTKFYNSGWVDMGTDGTGSGLTQPDIFLRVSGGAVVNSGTVSSTTVVVSEGSGGFTYV